MNMKVSGFRVVGIAGLMILTFVLGFFVYDANQFELEDNRDRQFEIRGVVESVENRSSFNYDRVIIHFSDGRVVALYSRNMFFKIGKLNKISYEKSIFGDDIITSVSVE